jgi:hypothetical protein
MRAFDERWYAFAPGAAMMIGVRGAGDADCRVGVWACSLRADRVRVVTPGHIEPGTGVVVPLQTVQGTDEGVPGVVESCVPVRGGEHRTHIRFDRPIHPARFAVCWGVVIDPDGTLIEITALARKARPGGRVRTRTGRADTRAERAANIVTVANELSRRAAEGADEAELREIADLLRALLTPEDQARAA